MKNIKWVTVGAVVILLASGSPAMAAKSPDSQSNQAYTTQLVGQSLPETAPQLSNGDQKFAEFVLANSENADPKAVERSVRYGNQISLMTESLQQKYPDTFVQGGVEHDSSSPFVAYFEFADRAPLAAISTIEAMPFPVQLRQGLPFSTKRLQAVHKVADAAVRKNPLVNQATSSADSTSGVITINAKTSSPDAQVVLTALVNKTLRATFGSGQLPEVRVIAGPSPVGKNDVLTGGTNINSPKGVCTSGFTVVVANNRSRGGLSTAAHCPDDMNYEGRNVLRYEGELLAPKSDLQWHELTNGEGIRNYIVYETGARTRRVIGYGNPANGLYMCRWGRTTSAKCDYVNNISGNTCGVEGHCGLFEMEARTGAPGDSGGPWWSGSGANAIARGIHSGGYYSTFRNFDIFTPIALLRNELGLVVYTG